MRQYTLLTKTQRAVLPTWERRCLEAAPVLFSGPFARVQWQCDDVVMFSQRLASMEHNKTAHLVKKLLLALRREDETFSLCASLEGYSIRDPEHGSREDMCSSLFPRAHRDLFLDRLLNLAYHWSSPPNEVSASEDWLDVALVHPLCVLKSIGIRPYQADHETGKPTYAPQAIQVVVCHHHEGQASSSAGAQEQHVCRLAEPAKEGWSADGLLWASPIFPVQNAPVLQHFDLPHVFAADARVRVRLLGKQQRKPSSSTPEGNKYFTCLGHVCIKGLALDDWRSPAPGHLLHLREEPLPSVQRAISNINPVLDFLGMAPGESLLDIMRVGMDLSAVLQDYMFDADDSDDEDDHNNE
eukprot:jgi/Botrbrau1/22573/Bobra.176_1s0006.1